MDALNNFAALRRTALRLMPLMLIIAIAFGNAMLCSLTILPQWRTHEQLMTDVGTNQKAADTKIGAQSQQNDTTVLNAQIDSAQTSLNQSAQDFLTQDQADALVGSLYTYADANGVQITNIQAQQSGTTAKGQAVLVDDTRPYDIRVFRVQALGRTPQLMAFVTSIREAAVQSVTLTNLAIKSEQSLSRLTMDILLFTSPYASGTVLDNLPAPIVLMTPIPAVSSPTPSAAVTVVAVVPTPTELAPISPTATSLPACTGAPPTQFQVGDTAVVDFNQIGALRILPEVSTHAVSALGQAYDNDRLTILAGPVCGVWKKSGVWYWYVQRKNIRGWVGEAASADDRWLCPVSNPECA